MVKVVWTDNALADLDDIGAFIQRESIRYAQLTVSTLFEAVDILETQPLVGKKLKEFKDPRLRQLIRGSYRIVYQVISLQQINIITVHHCSRLIANTRHFSSGK
jgi:addiction module RelE/StbE family toxin